MKLAVNDLTIAFGAKPICTNVSFEVSGGDLVGLVAPNGTGKTTLMKAVAGLVRAHGSFIIGDANRRTARTRFLARLFFVESVANLYPELTAAEHLAAVGRLWHSSKAADAVLQALQMQDYAHVRVKKLSLGMKQHVLLGMYVMSDAPVLMLDEPLNGLDPGSVMLFTQVCRRLQQEGKAIIMSSHQLDNVETLASRVFFLKDATLIDLPAEGVDLQAKYRELYLQGAALW